MKIKNSQVENPMNYLSRIRQYGTFFKFDLDWKLFSKTDKVKIRQVAENYGYTFPNDKDNLCISIVVPVIDNYVDINNCILHISAYNANPSLRLIKRINEYIEVNKKLPAEYGIDITLTSVEKVNLLSKL